MKAASLLRQSSLALLIILSVSLLSHAQETPAPKKSVKKETATKCHLKFNIAGWSIFYQTAKGTGVIRCSNGQHADVSISTRGGGVTFGKHEIKNGSGTFSEVEDISKLYGSYAEADAHAGAKGSAGAHAMTKGDISLAISGTGKGYDLGVAFGKFKITPVHE